jgi:hypothetical protein
MRTGDRGGKVEDAKALKTPCQIPLIVSRYCHSKLLRPLTFGHGVIPKLRRRAGAAALSTSSPYTAHGRPMGIKKLEPFLHSLGGRWHEGVS